MTRTWCVLCILGLLVASPAAAQDVAEELGVSVGYSPIAGERPLTLPHGILRVDVNPPVGSVWTMGAPLFTRMGNADPIVSVGAAATLGVTDDFEIEAHVLRLTVSPELEYGNPRVTGTWRLYSDQIEVGARLSLTAPLEDGTNLGMDAGIPARLRFDELALDFAPYFHIDFGDPTKVGLVLPFRGTYSVTPDIFVFSEGSFANLDLTAEELQLILSLTVGAGYVVSDGETSIADLFVSFSFPHFQTRGLAPVSGTVTTSMGPVDIWNVNAGARLYVPLF